ncbi:hypothetical protein LRY60_04980 [Candidatus Woesebacteria bacterium]|nr:hypothetical protein [Candidatus Woesebacteria bacterium]
MQALTGFYKDQIDRLAEVIGMEAPRTLADLHIFQKAVVENNPTLFTDIFGSDSIEEQLKQVDSYTKKIVEKILGSYNVALPKFKRTFFINSS